MKEESNMTHAEENTAFFCFRDRDDFRRLRDFFNSAGYNDKGVLECLAVKDFPSIRGNDVPLLLRRTNRGTPLDTLIRLFLIEVPVDVETLKSAIRPMPLESWLEAGLVEINGKSVEAAVKILPYQNLWLAFDRTRMLQTNYQSNYVMGIGSSTLTLSNLVVRKNVGRTLDLGTGCGIQALLAARHSDHVVATDINPRAVRMAEFNARLNGLTHVECVQGDLFEPIQGQKFDLVITNPPFVISPEKRYIYRDGGMPADDICRKIVREVPHYLNEGGFCQILCNWLEKTGQDWRQRLADWFAGTGCDGWVMRSENRDAATYASTWIRHTEQDNPDQYARRFEKWMAYYDELGIEGISAGLITMRRSGGHANWFRADDAPEKMLGPCGEYIAQGFELRDFLENSKDNKKLLEQRLRVSPHIGLDRHFVPSDKGWLESVQSIHLTQGFAYSGNIDPYVVNFIMRCNGGRRLKDLLSDMAASLGKDLAAIAPSFCDLVRGLIERGFLLPNV